MNLTQGQKILCGVVLAVALLLLASIRMTYFSDGAGSIKIRAKKICGNEPGKIFVPPKQTSTARRR